MKDVLLDENDDLIILNGDFLIGESEMQDVGIITRLVQGNLKWDPVLGPNLITMMNSNKSPADIKNKMKLHLQRDNKDYNKIKKKLDINGEYH